MCTYYKIGKITLKCETTKLRYVQFQQQGSFSQVKGKVSPEFAPQLEEVKQIDTKKISA
jgi:hypothetical protein